MTRGTPPRLAGLCCGSCASRRSPGGSRGRPARAVRAARREHHGEPYARRRYYGDVLSLWRRTGMRTDRSSHTGRRRSSRWPRRSRAGSHLRRPPAAAQPRCRDGHRPGARPGDRGQHRGVQPRERRRLPADRHRRSGLDGARLAQVSERDGHVVVLCRVRAAPRRREEHQGRGLAARRHVVQHDSCQRRRGHGQPEFRERRVSRDPEQPRHAWPDPGALRRRRWGSAGRRRQPWHLDPQARRRPINCRPANLVERGRHLRLWV